VFGFAGHGWSGVVAVCVCVCMSVGLFICDDCNDCDDGSRGCED